MKRIPLAAVVAVLISVMAAPSYAATEDIGKGMFEKAKRGVIDLVTGFVEFPVQICKGYKHGVSFIDNTAGSKTVGTVLGVFRGVGHAVGRTASGATELAGFWTANAIDNHGVGVPLDAQYAWEQGEQYSIFQPTLAEGVKPWGRKLLQGLGDGLLGIAEVPSQISKGKREGNIAKGVVRGVWFWLSREVYGSTSVYTCVVPNHKENPGYAFSGKWAWSELSDTN
jgi:hypothetical protein